MSLAATDKIRRRNQIGAEKEITFFQNNETKDKNSFVP
jgi:hypothetical protein